MFGLGVAHGLTATGRLQSGFGIKLASLGMGCLVSLPNPLTIASFPHPPNTNRHGPTPQPNHLVTVNLPFQPPPDHDDYQASIAESPHCLTPIRGLALLMLLLSISVWPWRLPYILYPPDPTSHSQT